MHPDIGIKLLKLSQHRRRFTIDQLAVDLRGEPSWLFEEVEDLREDGLLSYSTTGLELDARQRIMLAAKLIHSGRDPGKVSRFLEWQEFENFAVGILEENGFHATRHLVFKSKIGRREVDILAWNDTLLLAVDCKHWLRGLGPARMKEAAHAQVERTVALAERPEPLIRLGVTHPEGRRIIPVLFSLGEPRQSVAEGVPVVTVSKLVSFLYGISPVDNRFHNIPVRNLGTRLPLA